MEDLKENKSFYWLGQYIAYDSEYMDCVNDILKSHQFMQMDKYIQHGDTTTQKHCVAVSYVSYKICKKYNLDYRSAARAGLLHDMFLYDWHTHFKDTGKRFHGFTHPYEALKNAQNCVELNYTEKNTILRHMWPLTLIPPKTKVGFTVVYADKYCTMMETVSFFRKFVEFISAGI